MQVVGLRKAGPPHSTQETLNPQKLLLSDPKQVRELKYLNHNEHGKARCKTPEIKIFSYP